MIPPGGTEDDESSFNLPPPPAPQKRAQGEKEEPELPNNPFSPLPAIVISLLRFLSVASSVLAVPRHMRQLVVKNLEIPSSVHW